MRTTHMMKRCFLMTVFTTIILVVLVYKSEYHLEAWYSEKFAREFRENTKNWRNLTLYEAARLSVLGRILYLDEVPPLVTNNDSSNKDNNQTTVYKILVWKYGPNIEKRHVMHYSDKKVDVFEGCSVKNCHVTYEDSAIATADIVIIFLHRTKGVSDMPQGKRNPNQIWTFLTDESPYHTFMVAKNKISLYNGFFNWSMTYRMDSDIPVPYGRTVLRNEPNYDSVIPTNKRRDVLVAIMVSNCHTKNKRWEYITQLKKYIDIDIYGRCGTLKCPGHFNTDCPKLDNYLFYLSFENSNCDEYLTEKLWWNAYHKNSIPIVMGANRLNYSRLLPPESYLSTDDFAKPSDLAEFILYLNRSSEYKKFYQWKRKYKILQEHGYFQSRSFHYCRICEALNYNERKTKVYKDLGAFWNSSKSCRPAWNA